MPLPLLTADEFIQTLLRSQLPTVVVEGPSDVWIGRAIELSLSELNVDFLPVGGKSAVEEILERRSEFSSMRCAFVVDLDLWLFSGVP